MELQRSTILGDDAHDVIRRHPNEVIVILGWHDLTQARLYVKSVSWQTALEQMGVVGVPAVRFMEAVA